MRNVAIVVGLALFSCSQEATQPNEASKTSSKSASTSMPTAKNTVATLDAAAPATLPCAVDSVLRAKCQACHGHPTAQTAPMSLTTWDELHAQAPEHKDMPALVYERMAMRLHDRLRPMPPRDQPQLSERELSVLDDWLAAGAASGEPCSNTLDPAEKSDHATASAMPDAAVSSTPADAAVKERKRETVAPATQPQPSADAGVPDRASDAAVAAADAAMPIDPSECEFVDIRAQKDTTGTPFDVPADAADLYQCFLIDLAFTAPTQALAFEHLPDNEKVVHHWMLRTLERVDREPTLVTCDDLYPTNRLVASWSPGAPNWYLPKDVGVDLGRGLFILEIHYNNIGNPATTDRSGVRVCTTQKPRADTASVSWLGSQLFTIPPKTSGYAVSSRCTPTHQTDTLQILQATPHMHMHGVRASMRVDRADGTSQMLFDEPFAFGSEKAYRMLGELKLGDTLVSTCYYDNPDNTVLRMGTRTSDEMCHFFVAAYPPHQLVSDAFSLENDACLGAP